MNTKFKVPFLILVLFVHFASLAQNKTVNVQSKIESVTVFFQNAQINREANISIQSGETSLVVKDLSPFIDSNSIQAKIDGDVSILSVVLQRDFLGEKKVSEIEKSIERLEKDKSYLNLQITINSEEENFLKENKSIGGSNTGFQLSDLMSITAYYANRLKTLKSETLENRNKIKELDKEIQALRKQLRETQGGTFSSSGKVIVKVKSLKPFQGKMRLSYLVKNAGWLPSYDVRAQNIEQPLEISLKANLRQNTGEDWNNIKLTFSNADPTQNSTLPNLSPYYLNFNQVFRRQVQNQFQNDNLSYPRSVSGRVTDAEDGSGVPGVNIVVKGTTIGTISDIGGNYQIQIPRVGQVLVYSFIGMNTQEIEVGGRSVIDVAMTPDATELSEVVVTALGRSGGSSSAASGIKIRGNSSFKQNLPQTTTVTNQTTLEYTLDKPYTLKSGNESALLTLTGYEVPAQFEYQVVPKLQEKAFLIAKISDWSQYDLIEAPASLFFENTFIGKTILDAGVVSDTLNISLGQDKNVLIEREKLKEFQKKRFVGSNITETRAWKIVVRNQKSEPIKILIKDQVPISNNSDIEVDTEDLSGGLKNSETGEVTWPLTLNANEQKEFVLKYSVKYPKNRRLIVE